MKKLGSQILSTIQNIEGVDTEEFTRAIRAGKVRNIWAHLVEEAILNHTNGVYIINENNRKIMKVYVDESIYAAELNNRRELIQLLCQQRFGEVVDEFQIFISYGSMKQRYPFKKEAKNSTDTNPSIPLSESELQEVEVSIQSISKPELREQFKKAMIADLEWKKGNPQ